MKTLTEAWTEYRNAVHPGELPAVQESQLYQAWFASAFNILYPILEEVSRMPDEAAMAWLKKLPDESKAVCQQRADGIKSYN